MDNLQHEVVLVVDFGAQYSQLIARRVRECNVYCEVHPYTLGLDKIREMNPSSCPAVPTVSMQKIPPAWMRASSKWASLSWASATGISS